ncbi:hypothetical protein ACI65C_006686 [Semiaphis heraclei]
MDGTKTLSECGLISTITNAQSPATIGLALKCISDFGLLDLVLSESLYSGKLTINIICEFQFKMEVFMMIQRKNLTLFVDAKDNIPVNELKKMIGSILKLEPPCQQLYYKDEIMNGDKTLIECGLDFNFAKAHTPAIIGLALKLDNGEFEPLKMASYSNPPELPYVMSNHEADNQEPSM